MRDYLWQITAQIEVDAENGWTGSRQVPTFLLDPDVQGITGREHAVRIAEEILSTAGAPDGHGIRLHVTAEKVTRR